MNALIKGVSTPRKPVPRRKTIAIRAAEIRANWSPAETARRLGALAAVDVEIDTVCLRDLVAALYER